MLKRRFLSAGIILLLVVLAYLLSYYVFQIPLFDGSGWHTAENGAVQYLDYFKKPRTGWIDIESRRYYFDSQGTMQTGWQDLGGSRYYLGADGVMQTGWLTIEDDRYYLDADGTAHTGWLESGEDRYYFASDYRMQTGWLTLKEGKFYLAESGIAHTGWMTTPEARYYMLEDGAVATGFVTVGESLRYFLETGEYIPLVNPENPLTEDFQPQLVEVEGYPGYQVDATCVEALEEMLAACKKAGNNVKINSAYRDLEQQQAMWEKYRKNYMAQGYSYAQAEKLTAGYVAIPGTSEHHTGLGIDIGKGEKTYAWLAEHCWEYGFILRYPEGKKKITGFNYEPWHFRYLGKPLAEAVHKSGLTLEEYLQSIQ